MTESRSNPRELRSRLIPWCRINRNFFVTREDGSTVRRALMFYSALASDSTRELTAAEQLVCRARRQGLTMGTLDIRERLPQPTVASRIGGCFAWATMLAFALYISISLFEYATPAKAALIAIAFGVAFTYVLTVVLLYGNRTPRTAELHLTARGVDRIASDAHAVHVDWSNVRTHTKRLRSHDLILRDGRREWMPHSGELSLVLEALEVIGAIEPSNDGERSRRKELLGDGLLWLVVVVAFAATWAIMEPPPFPWWMLACMGLGAGVLLVCMNLLTRVAGRGSFDRRWRLQSRTDSTKTKPPPANDGL